MIHSLFNKISRVFRRTPKNQLIALLFLVVFISVDILVVYHYALSRYTTYHSRAFDLGNMDQTAWNTLHGNFFRYTNGFEGIALPPTRLAAHVEPIFLPVSLFYLIHSGPETLLLLQTVALALGSIPLYLLIRRKFPKSPFVAVAFVGAYLLSPGVIGAGLFDFHPVALATPLLLLVIWALDTERYKLFLFAAILAASCKEEVALALIPLGLFIVFKRKKIVLGSSVALCSLLWVGLCFFVIMPYFNGTDFSLYISRYPWLDHQASGNPSQSFFVSNDPNGIPRYKYLMLLLLTGGGFSIFSPLWLIPIVPEVFINIFSSQSAQYSGVAQYNAVIIPFLFAASVYGAAAFVSRFKKKRVRFVIPFIIIILLITSIVNILTVRKQLHIFLFDNTQPRQQQKEIDALLARIPQSASVTTTQTINPHVSNRYTLYLLSSPKAYTTDYIAIDLSDSVWQEKNNEVYHDLVKARKYSLVGTAGNVVLLKRFER